MYSTYRERKSIIPKRLIRVLKNNIFKHMTAISKNVYFDVLNDIVHKYDNTDHRTIKMKPVDVTNDSYAECKENSAKKDSKFKVGDQIKFSKCKNIFGRISSKLGRRSFSF